MPIERVSRVKKFQGRPVIPGDKSISHRSLLFGAMAKGTTEIHHLLQSGDVLSTARCLTGLGVEIWTSDGATFVKGRGDQGFLSPKEVLDCGNSGTTIRLLMGLLAGQVGTDARLTGDSSLIRRPMKRVAEPLRAMGAEMELSQNDYAPLTVRGRELHAIDYDLKVASAQIKTAIILAALHALGTTRIRGEIRSRDHTERMLRHFGVNLDVSSQEIGVRGGQKLTAARVQVPGDPSTAAFWMAGACLIPEAEIELQNISLNPTRTGFIRVLQAMGGDVRTTLTSQESEPIGNIQVTGGRPLKGISVDEAEIPSLIDELPMLAVLATQAEGVTLVTGAEELRVKETDRIEAVATNLRAMGARIETLNDGFRIEGPQKLHGATVESFHDHRIAMAFSIAGLIAESETTIHGADCVGISYPEFYKTLRELTQSN